IVDQSRAREAGRALFDAVYDRWNDLPATQRPKLLLFGVSLGSFSGEAAFSGEFDLRNRVDGALFAGPPNFNTLFREFTDGRDAGSPEIEPVFRDGRTVRFTADPSAPIAPTSAPWDGTRVLYLSHPSDPIVWWSTDLVLGRPDWLTEPAGRDVLDEMVWIPFVTFWQVTADMIEPVPVPQGHGHSYTSQYVDGWAAVISPPGWTAQKADALRAIVGSSD
ncbi:MAG TPA: alpha/beta-hydrolase family protein, partial [Nakamurella sp.]